MTTSSTKRLFLLRHALAVPPITGAQDIARALSPKGLDDAETLGKVMVQKGYVPDFILCSTATRTRQTLAKLMESLPPVPIQYVSDLYNCGTDCYVETVHEVKDSPRNILLIGHNPCLYEYAVSLIGSGRDALQHRLTEGYKPATLTILSAEIENWSLLKPKKAEILDILDPLDYNAPARPTRWT